MNPLGVLALLAAAGVGGYFLLRKPKPQSRWQPGSIITGMDPDEGWIQMVVQAVRWEDRRLFTVDNTEYEPQWWYLAGEMWYPEQFLVMGSSR